MFKFCLLYTSNRYTVLAKYNGTKTYQPLYKIKKSSDKTSHALMKILMEGVYDDEDSYVLLINNEKQWGNRRIRKRC